MNSKQEHSKTEKKKKVSIFNQFFNFVNERIKRFDKYG